MKAEKITRIVLAVLVFLPWIAWRVDAGRTIYDGEDGPVDYDNIQATIDSADSGDEIMVADGTYILQAGSLRVTILPQGAIDAGAQWRVDGGAWQDSGYTEPNLAVGSYTVEYSVVAGWNKPNNQTVQINDGQTTTTTGTYTVLATLCINEFMAINRFTILDGNGEPSDWIEIYNPTGGTVNLDSWYLTDNDANLTKWQFPAIELVPGGFLIVFASNKSYEYYPGNYPYVDPAGYYHTNFNLSGVGEYLALVAADGVTVVDEYAPEYPEQTVDISYGRYPDGSDNCKFFAMPTPGFDNVPKPAIIYVDADAAGANNGLSWADAFNYLQDALAAAQSGDEIHVAEGTYKPDQGDGIASGDRTATFQLINDVTLKGGYAGFGEPNPNARDIDVYETFLSGDLNGNDGPDFANNAENSYNVVTGNGADVTAMLDGFTITGGNADGSSSPYNRGGGMFCNSDATVSNCVFTGNSAIYGGGMTCFPTQEFTHPTLINCKFIGNSASEDGGGIRVSDSDPTLTNCTFGGNSAGRYGGGLMFNGDNVTKLVNCLVNDNSAGEHGGGIYARFSYRWKMTNCTLTKNSAEKRGGGIYNKDNSDMTFINCIIWGDSPEEIFVERSDAVTVNHCCIQGGWPGEGNIDVAPCFVDPENEDYHLLAGSLCIDTGDNSSLPPDSADLDGDGDTTEPISCDLDGNPRIGGNAVDMGAYEFQDSFKRYYHVDGVNGDNTNDGLTRETAFKTIQRGINAAEDGDTVLVWPGVYNEEIGFWGNAITVKSAAEAAVVETDYGYAFSFFSAEGLDTVLSNFVVRNSQYGIYLVNGSSPTLRNLTIVNNDFGISAFNGADPDISNCILWSNNYGDLFREPVPLQAKYSWVEDEIEANPVAHWKFDEGSGATAYDSAGTNDGTIYGAAWATGQLGGALEFDGVDDYVDVGDPIDESLDFGASDSFSISAWIRTNMDSPMVYKRRCDGTGGVYYEGYSFILLYKKQAFSIEDTSGGNAGIYGNTVVADDRWHHVVAVRDAGEDKLYIYADGSSDAEPVPDPTTGTLATSRSFHIGRRDSTVSPGYLYCEGKIDDVRIYGRALSAQKIQQLYQSSLSLDPMFGDPNSGDYHLRSERGRYWPAHDVWVLDEVTSPCIDGGDPSIDPSNERMPNGGRINMGAYGNTAYASMSECWNKADINCDSVVDFKDFAILANNWLETTLVIPEPNVPDTTPPEPAPTWDVGGEPTAIIPNSITMTATEAFDESGVEYGFWNLTTDPLGLNIVWQDERNYTDVNLIPNTTYCYRVQARDKSANHNTTVWSPTACAISLPPPDMIPPEPAPTWDVGGEPTTIIPNSITMTATEAFDESGVEYYFDAIDGGHDSGWQDEMNYTDVNLAPNTTYCYRVSARDKSSNQNQTNWSSTACATTWSPSDTLPPTPDPMTWDPMFDANGFMGLPREILLPPAGSFDYAATMRAIEAIDVAPPGVNPSEVEYYFECTNDSRFSSGWRTVFDYPDHFERRTYTVLVGSSGQGLRFRVKARDTSVNHNETAWSPDWPALP